MKLTEISAWVSDQPKEGILPNVKILGPISRNKNAYPESTRRAAVKMLEGSKVNIDHVKKGDVPLAARFGKLTNVRDTESGTYGDLHYNTKHPLAATVLEAAEHFPETLGMSILAEGKGSTKDKDGNTVIESIDKVYSVDLVSDPATVKSLFEAEEADEEEGEEDKSSTDHHRDGVGNTIAALLNECSDEEECMTKIKALVKAHYKLKGGSKEDEGEAKDTEPDEDVEESEKRVCKELCESVGLEIEPALIDTLVALPKEKRESTAKYLYQRSLVRTPRSGVPAPAHVEKDYTKIIRGV